MMIFKIHQLLAALIHQQGSFSVTHHLNEDILLIHRYYYIQQVADVLANV